MKVGERFDLTYCSNIHAGETWPEVSAALRSSLPRIRSLVAHTGPFGIGLRLSGRAATQLEEPEVLASFREYLRSGDYYVPTINGFPYGAFHGTRVKERVYLPDWRDPERVDYSNRLARLLAVLCGDAAMRSASISTVPGAFRADASSPGDVAAIAANILLHASYAKRLKAETGVTVSLAIEPEPACLLETTDEAVVFLQDHVLRADALAAASRASGMALTEDDVRAHVGLCLDACHMAVEFEDPEAAVARVHAAGLHVFKVQLSSAVCVRSRPGHPSPAQVLERFAEDTYLHQVVTSGADGLTRYTDLPDALEARQAHSADEWRVHFHVPIFIDAMSGLGTSQSYLARVIALLVRTGACHCLEVETYTWDVLPPELRTTDMCSAIARELEWVRQQLPA